MCYQVKQRMQILWSQSLCAAHMKRQKFSKWKRKKIRAQCWCCCCFCCHLALNAIVFVFMNCEIECEMPVFLHSLVICTTWHCRRRKRRENKRKIILHMSWQKFPTFLLYLHMLFRAHFKRIMMCDFAIQITFSLFFFFQKKKNFSLHFFSSLSKEKLLYCET